MVGVTLVPVDVATATHVAHTGGGAGMAAFGGGRRAETRCAAASFAAGKNESEKTAKGQQLVFKLHGCGVCVVRRYSRGEHCICIRSPIRHLIEIRDGTNSCPDRATCGELVRFAFFNAGPCRITS